MVLFNSLIGQIIYFYMIFYKVTYFTYNILFLFIFLIIKSGSLQYI